MDDRRIEETLRELWRPEPPEGMRERVLRRSRQELERRRDSRTVWRFALRKSAFAALALAVVLAVNVSDHYRQERMSALTQATYAEALPGGLLRQRRDMEKLLAQYAPDYRPVENGGERL